MSTQFLVTLTCVVAMRASALAQVTPKLAQNKPATQLRFQLPALVSGISGPTVPPATAPTPSPTLGTTPDQLYNTPRQEERDLAAAVQPNAVEQALRSDGSPDTIGAPAPPNPPQMEGMPYEFDWSVRDSTSGALYSHQESSDGTIAQGEYRVLLPDGRLQVVTFVDRGQGYEAQVVYQDYDGF